MARGAIALAAGLCLGAGAVPAERPPLPLMGPRTLPQGPLLPLAVQPSEGLAVFLDVSRITRTDRRAQAFLYQVLDPPQQAGNAPMAQTVEADVFDCEARTLQRDGVTGYDDMDTPVALGHRERTMRPAAGSAPDFAMKVVCDGWRPDGAQPVSGSRAAYEAGVAALARGRK
jgi:hypothetical protein